MSRISHSTPLSSLKGPFKRFLPKLNKLGLRTVRDLLRHFPSRYEDFSSIGHASDLIPGTQTTIQGRVVSVDSRRAFRRRMTVTEAIVEDSSGRVRAVWFNQPYLSQSLSPDSWVSLSGKVSASRQGEPYLAHPVCEPLIQEDIAEMRETRHTARIVGIYPETKGFTSRGIRYLIHLILPNVVLDEWIPENIIRSQNLPEVQQALKWVHFPETQEQAEQGRRRFTFEELFLLQLANVAHRSSRLAFHAPAISAETAWMKRVLAGLPFELTPSQTQTLKEILGDMEKPYPMNRLLQGDVGSGKTAVAALAALTAVHNGFQAVFMAPTEILASQHFATLKRLFEGIPSKNQPKTALLTSKEARVLYESDLESEIKKPVLLKQIREGKIGIVMGTHALIQKSVSFKRPGLVIVDEQHRFGVRQRATLAKDSGRNMDEMPHLLSMSATPIPRTLMLTVLGDLETSLITELPKGRKEILTKIITPSERESAYDFIRDEILKGRQAFVICPRISAASAAGEITTPSDEVKAVTEEYEALSNNIFPDFTISMLHGKMGSQEKDRVMKQFSNGSVDMLVSTSVVEVGVDVPNATVMMIERSDCFGLAQLYQLRGRVGRGTEQSYCLLMTDSDKKYAHARLNALIKAKNGFELAEYDLDLRGPGQFFGEAQTGFSDIAVQGLTNPKLVKETMKTAQELLATDPSLERYPLLKKRLEAFEKMLHRE